MALLLDANTLVRAQRRCAPTPLAAGRSLASLTRRLVERVTALIDHTGLSEALPVAPARYGVVIDTGSLERTRSPPGRA
jgi:hypothetical protein